MPSLHSALAVVLFGVGTLGAQISPPRTAPLREFRIDAGHSNVEFSIPFLGHAVRGRFDDVQGTVVYAPTVAGDPGSSAISVAIATASINTGSKHRDDHLRSTDFFDAARYPYIVFQSTEVAQHDGAMIATGRLTMRGVTRTIVIPFHADGLPVDDPHGSQLVHFTGSVNLARQDFGILGGAAHNDWFDAARSATMGDTVSVSLEVAGWRTDFARATQYDAAVARITTEGTAVTIARMRATIAANPAALAQLEWEIDQIGNVLLQRGRITDVIALLAFNVELFAKSASSHAALARAYELVGASADARAEARAALAISPVQTRAMEILRRVGTSAFEGRRMRFRHDGDPTYLRMAPARLLVFDTGSCATVMSSTASVPSGEHVGRPTGAA